MSRTTAREVADFFLSFAHEHGDNLSNLKLQKLVYYAQAWFLALCDAPLFDEDFQAWVHGPVCVPLYHDFKQYSWHPIMENPNMPMLDGDVREHLEEVYSVFASFSAYDLENMTHEEAPWLEARGELPIDEASTNVISREMMQAFYAARAKEDND